MTEKIVKGGFRATLALIIAIIALIFSIISYQRTGGMVGVSDEIKALQKKTDVLKKETIQQMEKLEEKTKKLTKETGEALEKLGKTLKFEDARQKK
jgi:cell division protein ZapA (FtsZ GTPase activity inhibitor)